jgi:serine/threonine protein phosphatase PrpC
MKKQWIYWNISQIGKYHIQENQINQDFTLCENFNWGNIITVADGLGSKKKSDIGSRRACETVMDFSYYYRKDSNKKMNIMFEFFFNLWKYSVLDDTNMQLDDYATTCLFAIQDENKTLISQIGDGLIMVLDRYGILHVLEDQKEHGFLNGTLSLSSNCNPNDWRYKIFPTSNIKAVLMMTDGISDSLNVKERKNFLIDFIKHFGELNKEERTIELKKVLEQWSSKDDKTIACLYLKESTNEEHL